ncbi:MAG TPA: DUF554 domain-containing protein [Spirochaetia bacterium]|nr:DUF554 domain-containing protein [Spirochaetia bacterium]
MSPLFTWSVAIAILTRVIATIVNCLAVIVGSLIGVNVHNRLGERFKQVVFNGVGLISLVIGIQMSLESTRIIYVALSLVIGGLLGYHWDIEGKILGFGEWLRRLVMTRRSAAGAATEEPHEQFAEAFLTASVLFCVGAMSLIGAFEAGAQGNYTLILTKSVMDGFMAIMLSAALGIGVIFSVIVILVYQGGLTLLASLVGPYVGKLILSEISGLGGILIIMIGLNLLELKAIKTANFLPGLVLVVILAAVDPALSSLFQSVGSQLR